MLRSHKYRPTANDFINVQDIWNKEGDSINSIKKQYAAKIKEEIPRPKVNYDPNFVEDTMPVTPLDYYDNDDGYWDDYIQEKLEVQGTIKIPKLVMQYKH